MKGVDSTTYITYEIRSGDSLSKIANRFHTTVDDIVNIPDNDIGQTDQSVHKDKDHIEVGYTLKIPAAHNYHVVVPGDTASGIAKQYGFTLAELASVPENRTLVERVPGKPFQLLYTSRDEQGADKIYFPVAEGAFVSDASGLMEGPSTETQTQAREARLFGDVTNVIQEEGSQIQDESVLQSDEPEITDDVALILSDIGTNPVSPMDAGYFGKTFEVLKDDLVLGIELKRLAHYKASPHKSTQIDIETTREFIREIICGYCPDDASFMFFIDTLLDAGVYDIEAIADAARGVDEIFSRLMAVDGFPGMGAGENDKAEFLFGYFGDRFTNLLAEDLEFGEYAQGTFLGGIDHLLKLSQPEGKAEMSLAICSVCAQHMGILLARMDVEFNYKYGVMGKIEERGIYEAGASGRSGFTANPTLTHDHGVQSELHVWLEVAGVEWEATSFMTREEVESTYSHVRGCATDKMGEETVLWTRWHWIYQENMSAQNAQNPAQADGLTSTMGTGQWAYQVLIDHDVDQYPVIKEQLDIAIKEDPNCVDLYAQRAEVCLRMATQMSGVGEERISLYQQACESYRKVSTLVAKEAKQKEYLTQALRVAVEFHDKIYKKQHHSGVAGWFTEEDNRMFHEIDVTLAIIASKYKGQDFNLILKDVIQARDDGEQRNAYLGETTAVAEVLKDRILVHEHLFDQEQWSQILAIYNGYEMQDIIAKAQEEISETALAQASPGDSGE